MAVSVLIPYTPSDEWRQQALAHVVAHYIGDDVSVGTHDGEWCKALAVADAARNATGDLYVIADADCLCDIRPAIQAVTDGAAWAIPHNRVLRLTRESTEALYRGEPATRTEEKHQGVRGGGIVVLPRTTYQQIPLDPRFVGWGHEDHSWGLALDCLAGPAWRGTADLSHLWHPPQQRDTRRIGNHDGHMLERRYWQARDNPDLMRGLIEEAKEATWTRQG